MITVRSPSKCKHLYTNPVYTYGQAGKPEISLSVDVGHTPVFKGEDMFMGGGASYLRFTNGDYSYVAYSGIGKGGVDRQLLCPIYRQLDWPFFLFCRSIFSSAVFRL